MSPPGLSCCADLFVARICDPTRRGRRVDFLASAPGLNNNDWHRGAYNASLPQGVPKGAKSALNPVTKAKLFKRLCSIPTGFASASAFDQWFMRECTAISNLAATGAPATLWTFGRSQKVLNVFLKYLCVAYHTSDPAFAAFHAANGWIAGMTDYLHAPVDRATIKHLASLKPHGVFGTSAVPISWWQPTFNPALYNDAQDALAVAARRCGIIRIHYEMIYIW